MAVSVTYDTLSSVTDKHYIRKLHDNFFYGDPVWVKLKGRRKPVDGGDDIRIPIGHSKSTAAKRWAGRAATFNAELQDHITLGVLPAVYYIVSLAIPQTDVIKNAGRSKILDLIRTQTELAEESLQNVMSTDLYLTGATSENADGIEGLHGLTHALTYNGNSANGAYMGITRASASGHFSNPTGNAFWNANVMAADANTTTTFFGNPATMDNDATLTLDKMQQMFGVACNGTSKPNLIVCGQALFNKYHSLLTAFHQQPTTDEVGKAGFETLQFNFKPIVASPFINSATSMYFLNMDTWEYKPYPDGEFNADSFKSLPNGRVMTKSIIWMGNIACLRPQENSLLTGVTAT